MRIVWFQRAWIVHPFAPDGGLESSIEPGGTGTRAQPHLSGASPGETPNPDANASALGPGIAEGDRPS
jgi:hypothetical protein